MTSTIIQNEKEEKWPRLMIDKNDGQVVLFICNGKCVTLTHFNEEYPIGVIIDDALMNRFQDFTGTIQLKND